MLKGLHRRPTADAKRQDQSGQDRYTTEIVANDMQMLNSGGLQQEPQQGGYQQPRQNSKAVTTNDHRRITRAMAPRNRSRPSGNHKGNDPMARLIPLSKTDFDDEISFLSLNFTEKTPSDSVKNVGVSSR